MILDDYAAFLTSLGIQFSRTNGFSVRFTMTNTDCCWIDIRCSKSGLLTLSSYFGTCYAGIRAVNRVVKELQGRYPQYDIWPEKYTVYEIDVEKVIPFETVDALHQKALAMATAIDESIPLCSQMLGEESFER